VSATLPSSASVVIIGGGIIGTSIAFHLAEAGVEDVLLLERDELAHGSTSKATGGIRSSFVDPANAAMGLRGLERYARFEADHGSDIGFRRNGYLYLLSDARYVEAFTEIVERQHRLGLRASMVTPQRAQELSPLVDGSELLAAAWFPDEAMATPEAAVTGYAQSARRLGARIARHHEVTGIELTGGAVSTVHTAHGSCATDTVVCAAGPWSARVGAMMGIDIPVSPVRRQVAFAEAPPNPSAGPLAPSPLTIDFPSSFYFHSEGANGVILSWADPAQPPGFDQRYQADGWMEKMAAIAARRAPSLLDVGIRSGWAGLYEVTPDGNQIIERSEHVDGLFIATGFSGHGFMMGPATGEIVRDLYLDRVPEFDLGSFRLDRFAEPSAGPSSRVGEPIVI
jgi:sarcosine oxidase, subunit beta